MSTILGQDVLRMFPINSTKYNTTEIDWDQSHTKTHKRPSTNQSINQSINQSVDWNKNNEVIDSVNSTSHIEYNRTECWWMRQRRVKWTFESIVALIVRRFGLFLTVFSVPNFSIGKIPAEIPDDVVGIVLLHAHKTSNLTVSAWYKYRCE